MNSDSVNSNGLDCDVHTAAQEARTGFQPWLFFFVASAFYFYEFFARVAPGVLKSDIRSVPVPVKVSSGLRWECTFLLTRRHN